ncbi:hypothetical protein, partial [Luteibacter sp.]|uniref:hypothetical protein n=1 Tax=Luteibacter sp. TaxID=1886636 RepID=UPI00280691DE
CNVLGPMEDAVAEACLENIMKLLVPGGTLVLDGIDLDLKSRVTQSLGLKPVTRYLEEIHTADPTKGDWPWTRWSHEPIDYERADWEYRYATVFSVAPVCERKQETASNASVAEEVPTLAVAMASMEATARSRW